MAATNEQDVLGPTDTTDWPTRWTAKHGLQPAYRLRIDRLPCCGCMIHFGEETSPCECRCHDAARIWDRIR